MGAGSGLVLGMSCDVGVRVVAKRKKKKKTGKESDHADRVQVGCCPCWR